MSVKIFIVEDEELYADQLEMLVEKLGYEHLGTVDNSTDALAAMGQGLPDLILMDIHIKGTHDGIELADLIHQQHPVPIIFITSLQDDLTFSRASRTGPINFLLKPFNTTQLQRTIELTVQQLAQQKEQNTATTEAWESDFFHEDYFFIKTRQRLDKVKIEDVLYLESDGHHCYVHTEEKKFMVRLSLSELTKRLPSDVFMLTHRSFLVNIKKVESVDLQDSMVIVGGKNVPISKRSKDALLKVLDWI